MAGRRLGPALVLWAVVLVGSALAAATGLRLDFSSRAFYGGGPDEAAFERFAETFGPDDDLLFVLLPEDVATAPAATDLAAALGRLPQVRIALPPAPLAARLADTHAERFVRSDDGRTYAMPVRLSAGTDDLGFAVEAVAAVAEVVGAAGLPGAELAGLPAVRGRFFDLALADQMRLTPVSFAAVGLVCAVALGRLRWGVVAVVLAGVVLAVQVGAMAASGLAVGLLNQAYFTVLPALSVGETLHLLAAAGDAQAGGLAVPDAVRAAVRRVRRATVLAAATTAAAMASLAWTGVPEVVRFGLGILPGLAAVVAVQLTLAPALVVLAAPCGPLVRRRRAPWIRWGLFAMRRRGLAIFLALAAAVGLGAAARNVPVDNRLSDLLDRDDPVRRASERLARELGGVLPLSVVVAPAGAFPDAAAWSGVERAVAAVPGVRAVLGPGALSRATGSPPLVAARRAEALGLGRIVAPTGEVRLLVGTVDPGGRDFEALARRVEAAVAAALPGAAVRAAGTARMAYRGVNRVGEHLAAGLSAALVVVVLVVALGTRRIADAAAAAVANGLPLLVAFVVVGLVRGTVDPLAATVLALALGIATDDTVHLLADADRAERAGRRPAVAFGLALRHSGWAAGWTSLALVAGFAVDLAASFPPLRDLALLGGTVLAAALVADLTVLGALRVRLRRAPAPRRGSAPTAGPRG